MYASKHNIDMKFVSLFFVLDQAQSPVEWHTNLYIAHDPPPFFLNKKIILP